MSAASEETSFTLSIKTLLINATDYCEKVKILSQVPHNWSIRRIMNTFGVSHSLATRARHYRRRTNIISEQRDQKSLIHSYAQVIDNFYHILICLNHIT